MSSEIVINATLPETRIAHIEDGEITDLAQEFERNRNVVGNIYKGRVTRVLPGMQAAFVDIGLERAAFLYVGEIVLDDLEQDPRYESRSDEDEDERGNSTKNASSHSNEMMGEESSTAIDLEMEAVEILKEETLGEEEEHDEDDDEDETSAEHEEDDSEENSEVDEAESNTEADSSEQAPETLAAKSSENEGATDKKQSARQSSKPHRGFGRNKRFGRFQKGRRFGRKGRGFRQPKLPNIQDILREGQDVMVQIIKAPMGTKGARLTCNISLPGRQVVLMPTVDHVGVSRKIASAEERRRLRKVINELRPPGVGFITRTMASGISTEAITNEVNYLLNLWSKIKQKRQKLKAPALLHEDLNLVLRTVRDQFTDDIYRLVIDSPRVHSDIIEYIGEIAPHLKNRTVKYTGKDPIFDTYGIDNEISRALNKKVWLKSGGYLIIDQAEALTVIDVNTGKFIGKSSLADTIYKTNLEAVKEVAYQLRLRNVGGIIIIDLIDMEKNHHKESVYRALEIALKKDRAKTNILRISELGLIQMTRKRTNESLNKLFCEPCPYCNGTGLTKNLRTICYDVFREIERTAIEGGITGANVVCHPEVMDMIYHEERETLSRVEERFGIKVTICGDSNLHLEAYEVIGERLSFQRH